MFFKNAVIFTFPVPKPNAFAEIDAALAEHTLNPVGGLDLSVRGFIPPIGGEDTALSHKVHGGIWLAIGGEDRVLPAAAVNQQLKKRLDHIEALEGRKPGGRARKRLKEEVLTDMIPKAFSKPYRSDLYLNTRLGIIVVNTSSAKSAEAAVSLLRHALGSFPAIHLGSERPPAHVLTSLFKGDEVEGVALGEEIELKDPAGEGVIRALREDLHDEDLKRHINNGKHVSKLGVLINGRVDLVVGDDLVLRKMDFLGSHFDDSLSDNESREQDLKASFQLFHADFDELFVKLAEIFQIRTEEPAFQAAAASASVKRIEFVAPPGQAANDGATGQGVSLDRASA